MKRKFIVCDIDGTISKVGDRIKYLQETPTNWDAFYNACFDDEEILPIMELLWMLLESRDRPVEIVFCTGRRESVRDQTEKWLREKELADAPGFGYGVLMRPDNDYRHDTEVKPEQLKAAGIHPGNTHFILEDRNSMVKKWRELGFTCLQVAEGDF